jgi:hypothetical protein
MKYEFNILLLAGGLLVACLIGSCSGETDSSIEHPTPSLRHTGTDQSDILTGTDAAELIVGLEGLDLIEGHGGNDVLDGGPGGDSLLGGDGDDTYLYNLGDHGDIIQDSGGLRDIVRFGRGIDPESLTITEHPTLLHVVVGDAANKDHFLIHHWGEPDYLIEEFVFENGVVFGVADIEQRIEGNRRPRFLRQLEDQVAVANRPFRFEIPEDSYVDPEGSIVQIFARSLDNRLLRDGWLGFDSDGHVFRGTPSEGDVAETRIRITLVDSADLTSTMVFKIRVVSGK